MKNLNAIVLSLFLVGCSTVSTTNETKIPFQHPSAPPALVLDGVEFNVANRSEVEELLKNYPSDFSWFILDAKNYENLAKNVEKVEAYLRTQQERIRVYREFIDAQKK